MVMCFWRWWTILWIATWIFIEDNCPSASGLLLQFFNIVCSSVSVNILVLTVIKPLLNTQNEMNTKERTSGIKKDVVVQTCPKSLPIMHKMSSIFSDAPLWLCGCLSVHLKYSSQRQWLTWVMQSNRLYKSQEETAGVWLVYQEKIWTLE